VKRSICAGTCLGVLAAMPALAQGVLADFPLECRVTEPANYSATQQEREVTLVIERAADGVIFSYPKDASDHRRGGVIFPQIGYFVRVTDGKELLEATDSVTQHDLLQLRREPGGTFRFALAVKSNRAGGAMQGTCRKTQLAVSRFPFRDSLWPAQGYAEARLYFYNEAGNTSAPIYENGKFSPLLVKDVKLDRRQIAKLVAATTGEHRAHAVAACYQPRHAFVFLDAQGRPLSFAEICFDCANYRLSNSKGNRFDLAALADLVEESGLPLGGHFRTAAAFKESFQRLLEPK